MFKSETHYFYNIVYKDKLISNVLKRFYKLDLTLSMETFQ